MTETFEKLGKENKPDLRDELMSAVREASRR